MKKLLLSMLSIALLVWSTFAYEVPFIAHVRDTATGKKCSWLMIDWGWDYPTNLALAVAYVLGDNNYLNNPSAIFLSGSTIDSATAWARSLWIPSNKRCMIAILN